MCHGGCGLFENGTCTETSVILKVFFIIEDDVFVYEREEEEEEEGEGDEEGKWRI